MLKFNLALPAAILCCGCSLPDRDAPAHTEIQLEMSLADVQKKLGEDGEVREEAKLPVSPKPRAAYPKLPKEVEYRLWTPTVRSLTDKTTAQTAKQKDKRKQATILLGVLNGKVVFKQVIHSTGGKIKTESFTTTEYQ